MKQANDKIIDVQVFLCETQF